MTVEPYVPEVVLSVTQATTLVERVDEAKRTLMREGADFGTIRGTERPSLLKPGAERLLQLFALGHRMEILSITYDAEGRRHSVTVECRVTKGDVTVGSCIGECSYDEDRWHKPGRQASETPETGERISARREYRAPWNTLLKMAQKRALVGAALQVTGSSGLFTQDGEDEGTTRALELVRAVCREIVKEQDKEVRDSLNAVSAPGPDWGVEQWAQVLVELGRILERRVFLRADQ